MQDIQALNESIKLASAPIEALRAETRKVIVGQDYMIDRLLIGVLSSGHILLEGVPGLAKTLAIKSLSEAVSADFSRIQFTPDLLPADIIGTMIYNPAQNEFKVKKGPIFSNFVLADEINRAPAKVQSALLEAMQERQVTIGDETFGLNSPFLVMATQNPIDQEGTYPLPEAQTDRFLLKVVIDYPTKDEEMKILRQNVSGSFPTVNQVLKPEDILTAQKACQELYMDEKIEQYIVDITFATRNPKSIGLKDIARFISFGGSPRATIAMAKAAKAYAFLERRGFVVPEDVKAIAHDVLRHRIGLTFEAEAENISVDEIISQIITRVEIP